MTVSSEISTKIISTLCFEKIRSPKIIGLFYKSMQVYVKHWAADSSTQLSTRPLKTQKHNLVSSSRVGIWWWGRGRRVRDKLLYSREYKTWPLKMVWSTIRISVFMFYDVWRVCNKCLLCQLNHGKQQRYQRF